MSAVINDFTNLLGSSFNLNRGDSIEFLPNVLRNLLKDAPNQLTFLKCFPIGVVQLIVSQMGVQAGGADRAVAG
jgi:hypothetical protein